MVFLEVQRTRGVYSRVKAGMILQSSCLFSNVRNPVLLGGIPLEAPQAWEGNTVLLEVRQETEVPFLFATVILEFLSIFKKSQVSSPFEALNTACFSRCQKDVRLLYR